MSDPAFEIGLLFWGGGIALVSSLLTTTLGAIVTAQQEKKKREYSEKTDKSAIGRQRAESMLPIVLKLREQTVGKVPVYGNRSFDLDIETIRGLKTSAILLSDSTLRSSISNCLTTLGGLGPAEPDLPEVRYVVERTLINHAFLLLAAYVRHDDLPPGSMKFIDDTYQLVKQAWKDAEEAGETFKV